MPGSPPTSSAEPRHQPAAGHPVEFGDAGRAPSASSARGAVQVHEVDLAGRPCAVRPFGACPRAPPRRWCSMRRRHRSCPLHCGVAAPQAWQHRRCAVWQQFGLGHQRSRDPVVGARRGRSHGVRHDAHLRAPSLPLMGGGFSIWAISSSQARSRSQRPHFHLDRAFGAAVDELVDIGDCRSGRSPAPGRAR